MQTKTDTCANSVDLDDTARHEPCHLDLHCLPVVVVVVLLFYFRMKHLFASVGMSKFKVGRA